jgi:hypothetical protein
MKRIIKGKNKVKKHREKYDDKKEKRKVRGRFKKR